MALEELPLSIWEIKNGPEGPCKWKRECVSLLYLYLNINHLPTTVHAVGGIDPVGAEEGAVGRVLGQLGSPKLIGSTAFA